MRQIYFLLFGFCYFSLGTNAISQPQTLSNTFSTTVSLGYGGQSLKDINADIMDDEQLLQSFGIPVGFNTFGGALDLGFELGYHISPIVSLGACLNYQGNKITDSYSDFSGSLSIERSVNIFNIMGNIGLWLPTVPGFHFSVGAGIGIGKAGLDLRLADFFDPRNNLQTDGNWNGNGFVAEGFTGYRVHLAPAFNLLFRGGYRYRNLGQFGGSIQSLQLGNTVGPYQNNAGQPLDFDFSGFYFVTGLSVFFNNPSAQKDVLKNPEDQWEDFTSLPNFRAARPQFDKYSAEQILAMFRKKYPSLKNKSDDQLIRMIEAKYRKKIQFP